MARSADSDEHNVEAGLMRGTGISYNNGASTTKTS